MNRFDWECSVAERAKHNFFKENTSDLDILSQGVRNARDYDRLVSLGQGILNFAERLRSACDKAIKENDQTK
jgi:hypothetical protein